MKTFDDTLERTPAGIPASLRPFFQEYVLEDLDPERSLYFIASHISLDELFARSSDKYPQSRGFGMRVLTALVDFDIADQQDEPTMLRPVEWDRVKTFFLTQARQLGQKWFGQAK